MSYTPNLSPAFRARTIEELRHARRMRERAEAAELVRARLAHWTLNTVLSLLAAAAVLLATVPLLGTLVAAFRALSTL